MRRPIPSLVFAFLAAASVPAAAQANLSVYVSVGDSLAAGYSSNSLVETHQRNSVPALIARQSGAHDFQQPLISEPGLPPELTLISLPAAIVPKASAAGAPQNLALPRPYNNLAVPGATVADALTRTEGGGFHDLILRGLGTQVQQALLLHPTFITVWIGNNDVLGAALRGRAVDGVTLTPAPAFRAAYQQVITTLKGSGAGLVAATLPDVTAIPFVTTLKPYLLNPATNLPVQLNGQNIPLLGPDGPLTSSHYVTLAAAPLLAQGVGIPTILGGQGTPLPDEVVLDPTEVAFIRQRVAEDNQAIQEICLAAGVPVLDLHGVLDQLANEGIEIGGIRLTNAFLTGGVFSYDGVHLTDLGYAVVANYWIRLIDSKGGAVPEVSLTPYFGLGGAASGRVTATMSGHAPAAEFSAEAYQELLAAFPPLDR